MEEPGLLARLSTIEAQLSEMLNWIHARMPATELEKEFNDLIFQTRQLISIMQGTRDDLVLMRKDLRRLASVVEQTLRVRVEDEERSWRDGDPDRRVNSIPDRRRAS